MTHPEYPNTYAPFQVGPVTVRNRLVALPVGTSIVEDGIPTHGDTEHFERLAEGGVGLIIGGATVVHPSTTLRSRKLIEAYIPEVVPALEEKASAVHRHGARIFGQLVHLGREFIGGEADSPPVAPSAIKTVRDAYPPHELAVDEIADIVDRWKRSTRNLVLAGYDGVEVHAAHGYLVGQFMSPTTNRRTDEYGGDFRGRMRFLDEVLDAMRSEIGDRLAVGVRLSAEEEIPGGMGLEDCVRIARHLESRGDVDYLSITHGTRGTYVKDATHPDAVAKESAARIRHEVSIPVLVGQRIRDVATAEHLLKTGKADLVGMARALIADPELPEKSRTGRGAEVRGCLGINQDCRSFDPHLHCAVNAEIGRRRPPTVGVTADRPGKVFVIGGGPAGLEAARVSAGRGHHVTLFEAAPQLGGAVLTASRSPHRATIVDIIDYLGREMRRLGVDVNLGARIEPDDIPEIFDSADSVVIATGARPSPNLTDLGGVPVIGVEDVLDGKAPPTPGRAVVHDPDDGFWPAYSAAEALIAAGWKVTFTTGLTALASRVPAESAAPLLRRLGSADVEFRVGFAPVRSASTSAVTLSPVFGGEHIESSADLVVWHGGRRADRVLAGVDGAVYIGDCVTPRRISHAIAEGYRVGTRL